MNCTILKVNNWTFYVNPKCGIRTINNLCNYLNRLPKDIFKKKLNIVIFRNPFNRLISGYLNKYVHHTKYLEKIKINNNINKEEINTFFKFVKLIEKKGICILDRNHFDLQVRIIPDNIKIDKVFITEEINILIKYINNIIKDFNSKLILDENKFKFKGNTKHNINYKNINFKNIYDLNRDELNILIKDLKVPSYDSFYTDELKQIVKFRYKKDFDFYNKFYIL